MDFSQMQFFPQVRANEVKKTKHEIIHFIGICRFFAMLFLTGHPKTCFKKNNPPKMGHFLNAFEFDGCH